MKLRRKFFGVLVVFTMFAGCSSAPKAIETPQPKAAASPAPGAPEAKKGTPAGAPVAPGAAEGRKRSVASLGSLKCVQSSDHRMAEVHQKGAGCEVAYSKLGETNVIASSAAGTKHCEDVMSRIRKNLISGGFQCE